MFLPQPRKRRGILIESLLFVCFYLFFLLILGPDSPVRVLVETLTILASSLAAVLLILFSISEIPESSRRAWVLLGIFQMTWLLGHILRQVSLPAATIITAGDIVSLLAYCMAAYALLRYPFTSLHAPTRFRFVLDSIISAGVVITLGWLLFLRPLSGLSSSGLDFLVIASYPIADLALLIILTNVSLAKWMPRVTAMFLGGAWIAFLISDFIYSSLSFIGGYRAGTLVSLGWVCGALLIGLGATFEKQSLDERRTLRDLAGIDLGIQFQKVLPIALVIVLFWYVLTDWRLRGQFFPFGLWTSLLLGMMLVVRLGIRAGEAELNRYWQLFKNLADPAFICDDHGNLLVGNPACAGLFGTKDPSQLAGRSLAAVFGGLRAEDFHLAVANDHTLNTTLNRIGAPYLVSLSPILTESRRKLIAGVAHDLSEQKRQQDAVQRAYDELQSVYRKLEDFNVALEQEVEKRTATLQQAYRQLEEQNQILQALDQIKSDFVSMVSHELRAPLTNLNGGLELLLNRRRDPAEEKTLVLIQAEIQRLTRFVENILSISAMEAGRLDLHPALLSLPAALEQVRRGWVNLPEYDRIAVEFAHEIPPVFADADALRSVLGHLIDNALKYAPESRVQVYAGRSDGRVRVEVRDFGPGIPPEKQGLLFERFQRLDAKDSQSVYGYGLGLYLSRRLLRAMDSDLQFESPIDGGARFYFYLNPEK